jgi:RNA polymerase sigma-70 factor (ECF subfamily)
MDESWVEKYADRMYSYARVRLSDNEEIRDVIQEALLAAVKSREKFRGDSEEFTWLVGILRHKIHDVYRAHAKKNKYFIDNLESGSEFSDGRWPWNVADTHSEPAQIAQENFVRENLYSCIDQLPEAFKIPLQMRELDNVPTPEICNILSLTPTNLNVILFRARVKLKKCLESKGIDGV